MTCSLPSSTHAHAQTALYFVIKFYTWFATCMASTCIGGANSASAVLTHQPRSRALHNSPEGKTICMQCSNAIVPRRRHGLSPPRFIRTEPLRRPFPRVLQGDGGERGQQRRRCLSRATPLGLRGAPEGGGGARGEYMHTCTHLGSQMQALYLHVLLLV